MKSYTTYISDYKSLTQNQTTENETLGAQLINDSIRTVCNMRGGRWPWLEATTTVDTVASQDYITIPNGVEKIADLYVRVGDQPTDVIYMPVAIFDSQKWKLVIASRLAEGDVTLFYYPMPASSKIFFAPTPATTGNEVHIRYRKKLRDLSIADYTTGSIVSIANGAKAVVGSGTTWTTSMAGRYIRITESNTDNKGDGQWYEIASVGSATTLTLVAPYEGTSIAVGTAAYTIGQMSVIPEPYDTAPLYRAVALYWQSKDSKRYEQYMRQYDAGYEAGLQKQGPGGIVGQLIETFGETAEGAYISPNNVGWIDPNNPPRWPLTGFNP